MSQQTPSSDSAIKECGAKRLLPEHIILLDALRGLGALAVVFWHWQHFFYHGTALGDFAVERQPLYGIFHRLYTDGWRAVDLFFCMSGFIFYWLYSERIAGQSIGLRHFFVLRFSRLYPLHLVTLLWVGAVQIILYRQQGGHFVYPYIDLKHFTLQLFLISEWGFADGGSFNGPIWSVSIEVLLYGVFFLACRRGWVRPWNLILLMLAGCILLNTGIPDMFARGILSFFAGGLSFHVFRRLWERMPGRAAFAFLNVVTLLLWIVIPMNATYSSVYALYRSHLWSEGWSIGGEDIVGGLILKASPLLYQIVLYPLTVITLALWTRYKIPGKGFLTSLGNISYSVYLLHFPLQLLVAAILFPILPNRDLFYSPLALILFFAVLIPLSLASYRWLERPAQIFLRNRLTTTR